jgi:hypothetical protein
MPYLLVANVIVVVLATVMGIAAIRTGWAVPWLRKRIHRPHLWGYGWLALSASSVVLITGDVFFTGSEAVIVSQYVLLLVSAGLMIASHWRGQSR